MLRTALRPLAVLVLAAAAALPGASAAPPEAAKTVATFHVRGTVTTPLVLRLHDLRALPQHTETVTFQAGPVSETHVFRGPYLRDVIGLAGPVFDPAIKNDSLRHVVAVTGSDGYRVVVAWGEIDPGFEGKPVLVAIKQDGALLTAPGPRLVVPGDLRGGRYVFGIADIDLVDVDAAIG
jgi:hypothetical protein